MTEEHSNALVWQARPTEDVLQELLPAEMAAEEASALADELPEIRRRFEGGPELVRRNLSEMTTFLRASEADVGRMMGRGFFRNMWSRLTGRQARDEMEVRQNLTRVQARALCVTERLLERQEYLEQATRFVGARIELLSMENLKLKAALVRLGQRIFDRVESLEDRVSRLEQRSDSLERRVSLSEFFQSGFSVSAQLPYERISDPLERVLRLTMDFSKAAGGEWRPIDFYRLEKMALSEARVTDELQFSISDLVDRAANLRDKKLLEWLSAGSLQERLMAPPDESSDDARSFYPLHFLFQRPHWFVKQGLPRAGLQMIAVEIGQYGLDPDERLGLWQIAQLLLEERLAWSMESGELLAAQAKKEALPSPQSLDLGVYTLRSLPVGDVAVQDLYLVADELLVLGWMRRGAELCLMHFTPDGFKRISRQPNWNRAAKLVVGGNSLWTLSADRRGADGWIFDRQNPVDPWSWRSITLPSVGGIDGLAAKGAAVVGWRMNRVYLRDAKGNFFDHPVPRRVVDCAIYGGGLYILDESELYDWRPSSDLFAPIARLTDGFMGQRVETSESGKTALIQARDRQGCEALIAVKPNPMGEAEQNRQFFQDKLETFAMADDDHAVVQTADGHLWRFSQVPSEERISALAPAGHERLELLACDGAGHFAGLDRAEGIIHVFLCR